ncbi:MULTISPECIES: site-2 protease family protein [unclassified Corynebacterium]|uniref:M50 family metallopeptidase n=1 Tax=unclassified Corynebacterium TaxID=2624378 RepID=UPI0029C9CF82|nr:MULTISPECIES: site-2 protease family protein [unclassified Corynebacterium]WPF65318.1 site-2 protease family protein [Corynebacterium sp. 22KM0430]WPF67813.1 site-2 protease family protein [Corynebacterium sp. 21KM1197]
MAGYLMGMVLFALGIAVTIALHEWGHLAVARACGMRVRRYFIGFGPKVFSFRRGGTEYGLKALPFGGFCDIAGMTAQDPALTPEEEPHAMYKKAWWKRIAVLLGGITMNLIVGLLILYGVAMTSGLPNPKADLTPTVAEVHAGPAQEAGVRPGDRIVELNGQATQNFGQLAEDIRQRPGETLTLTIDREGQRSQVEVVAATGERGQGVIGVASAPVENAIATFGPVEAVGVAATYAKDLMVSTVQALGQLPAKIPGVVASIFGAERAADSPMSVVGASRAGGEFVERSYWGMFWMLLASLNFFLAVFNLIPLPPFDGGHVAVVLYEKVRDALRRLRGLAPAGPADYTRLMPLTYAIGAALLTLGLVFVVADVVNPVRLFP